MADMFGSEDARRILQYKFVLLLGSSSMRATYKDLILLINRNELITLGDLRRKGEDSFEGDRRIGHFNGLIQGRHYEEGREFTRFDTHLEYHFITRCYNAKIEMLLNKIKTGEMKAPDIIIMNSCVWDISRWGPNGVDAYKENMRKLMDLLKKSLPRNTLFIWATASPISTEVKGGLLIKQLDFMQSLLRFEVMEANLFCRNLVVSYGYDVLDTHHHLRMQLHRRLPDGLHYGPKPVRYLTNLILTHISLSYGAPLPGNSKGIALENVIRNGVLYPTTVEGEVHISAAPSLCSKCKSNENVEASRKKTTGFRKFRSRSTSRGRPSNEERNSSQLQIWRNENKRTNTPRRPLTCNYWNFRPRASNVPQFPPPLPSLCDHQNEPANHWQPEFEQDDYFNCGQTSRVRRNVPRCSLPQPSLSDNWGEPTNNWQQDFQQNNYSNTGQTPRVRPFRKTNRFATLRQRPY